MPTPDHLHLAVALDGAGWHPAAWRSPQARPAELFTAGYWADLVRRAEAGLVDLATFEDGLALQSSRYDGDDRRTDEVRGRLDAVLVASRVAPLTQAIGLVPSVTATHTEPFHVSKAVATLDFVSQGRAGVRVQVSGRPHEAAHFGRRTFPETGPDLAAELAADGPFARTIGDLFAEAADHVEVQRRLWDSWEDGAEIRDAATGRFVDRDRLHYIDFQGRFFSVKGPSITPRPPQGQPLVAVLAHLDAPARLGGTVADLVLVTPRSLDQAADFVTTVRSAQADAGRADETVHVFADVAVLLAGNPDEALERLGSLDALAAAPWTGADAHLVAGTAGQVAGLLEEWRTAGITGFRLRPARLPEDLDRITADLVPELQRRGLFRTAYAEDTLRARLGLPRPADRYAA